jgi:hypothetical protein
MGSRWTSINRGSHLDDVVVYFLPYLFELRVFLYVSKIVLHTSAYICIHLQALLLYPVLVDVSLPKPSISRQSAQ